MKNSIFVLVILFFSLSLTMTGLIDAEMYKYVDENGQTRWTDDLGQVPKAYREEAQMVETINTEPESLDAAQANEEGNLSSDSQPAEANEEADSASTATLDPETLEKEKADLDALYRELQGEKKNIEQLQSEATGIDAKKELNNRIDALNEKTQQYTSKLNQFNERVKAYNQRIEEQQIHTKTTR